MAAATSSIPNWKVSGDWFDVCKCNIPCPCIFAQTPTYVDCDGTMAYHINGGSYGETILDGLNVLILDSFKGNIGRAMEKQSLMWQSFLMRKPTSNSEKLSI
jgi:hypothetical protein